MMAQNAANAAAAKAGQSATQQQKDAWRSALGQSVQDATGQIAKAFAGRQAPVYQPAAMSSPVLAEAANISAPIFPGATKFASSLVENQALNDAMMQQARLSGGGSQGYRF